ncbi:glycosyltransferase [Aeromonas sp. QDB11]|uniref:glycosyltransferase n=1 Tax=Aeromonas sp. QDB11 TaxID=2990482 RepID=UPI0022E3C6CC|nr:glycosyltransferase [Aeromonas sp. QDB11]
MYDDLLIVIVTYKKRIKDIQFFNEVNLSVHKFDVLVYDNSPLPQLINEQDFPYLKYIHDSQNPGVSAAYNCAFKHAERNNKKVVLLLDQDTTFKTAFLPVYFNSYTEYGDKYIYAPMVCNDAKSKVYSPSGLRWFVGKAQQYNDISYHQVYCLSQHSVINSGLMIPLSLFNTVGGYNEKIKLDFSDVYFIERYKEINNHIILLPINIMHSLSGDEGYDKERELHRFKYYCVGARELAKSLEKNTFYTVLRRMIRLVMKYRTLNPLATVAKYYLSDVVL